MIKVGWKKSRCFRGVRDWSVQARLGTHGVIEIEVRRMFTVALHQSVYLKLQHYGNPLYELRRKIKGLFEIATGDRCNEIYVRLVDEAVKAVAEVMLS